MIHSLTIAWQPAYELILSLAVFVDRQRWKATDLGTAWGAGVEKRLRPETLAQARAIRDPHVVHTLFPLVAKAPSGEVEPFLAWLTDLGPGELYGCLHPHVEEIASDLPWDLVTWRDRLASLLTEWHAQYFRHIDPAILAHLQAEADFRRAQAETIPADDLVMQATMGLNIADDSVDEVLLIPQYHMCPWNVGDRLSSLRILLYPAELPRANSNDPPLALVRLGRALGDESRLRILRFLGQGPMGLVELTARTGLAKSTVHHHMVALRAAGLVVVDDQETSIRFRLRPAGFDHLAEQFRAFVLPTPKEE